MASNPLIGTWSLADGQVSHSLGKDASGYIMYNDDGYMFVAIMAPKRLRFAMSPMVGATTSWEIRWSTTWS